jgi:hypothetical protein
MATAVVRSRWRPRLLAALAAVIGGLSTTGVREGRETAAYAVSVVRVSATVFQRTRWAGRGNF